MYFENNEVASHFNSFLGSFHFNHVEPAKIIIATYAQLHANGCMEAVVVDCQGTDVYEQAAYISHKLPGLLCIRRKNANMFCRAFCSDELADVIISMHVITGCDSNSGFIGMGRNPISKQSQILRPENFSRSVERRVPFKPKYLKNSKPLLLILFMVTSVLEMDTERRSVFWGR